jgi:hypothetical protein
MIVISFGVRKSGTTLAFEMAKAVLELNGHPQSTLPDHLTKPGHDVNEVGPLTDEWLSRVVECTQGRKIVVRTHSHPYALSTDRILDSLDAGEVKIHVVFRDPRDTVLSMFDDARSHPSKDKARTVDDAIERLRPRFRKLQRWGSFPSLKLLYDDFVFDRARGPQLIADDLGVTVDPDEVWRIVNHRWTRKNVALPHRYKTEMSPADAARIEAAFPEYLELVENHDLGWFDGEKPGTATAPTDSSRS